MEKGLDLLSRAMIEDTLGEQRYEYSKTYFAIWCADGIFAETGRGLADIFGLLGWHDQVYLVQGNKGSAPWAVDGAEHVVWVLVGVTHMPSDWSMPRLYFLYQMEQLCSPWITEEYIKVAMGALSIWDFAPSHTEYWRKSGLSSVYVPLSIPLIWLAPNTLNKIQQEETQKTDVLFFGSSNKRRLQIQDTLEARLAAAGHTCAFYMNYDLFGQGRDSVVDNATVVLNIHYYEHAALEVHRINYLLARGKCVLSEWSVDSHLDSVYSAVVAFTPTESLADVAIALLKDHPRRSTMEQNATEFARHLPYASGAWLRPIVEGFNTSLVSSVLATSSNNTPTSTTTTSIDMIEEEEETPEELTRQHQLKKRKEGDDDAFYQRNNSPSSTIVETVEKEQTPQQQVISTLVPQPLMAH
eukprot:CAMPEP_0197304146 /NCGR_PEP_ID=MMETSP0890-20130614/52086_1 /TAXON_ID=44058 ORGANISM="Aureoumbra lagunensis, Strain CCMP1510" /NCGR_SAMPLE_ID=MMETSP0890 /ASSEMBLY_ACC=CAM_ASM_000533 /LENGTH=411 /DNA_ID=CAMNT_0042784117 /DNA_START=318 /DNA_END=1553 /DNA_ORIENTATION=-